MMAMIEGEGEFLKQGKEVGSLFSAFVVPRVTFGVLTKANFSWLRGYSGFRPPPPEWRSEILILRITQYHMAIIVLTQGLSSYTCIMKK